MGALNRLARRLTPKSLAGRSHRPGRGTRPQMEAVYHSWVRLNGRWVVNFCSANFLGFNCTPWAQACLPGCFSLGLPRDLAETRLFPRVEELLANLVSQESALIFPSTTHAALDILPLLAGRGGTIFLDEQAYPISKQAAAAAQAKGAHTVRFKHNNPGDLDRKLRAGTGDKAIVCDGVYPLSGGIAPLQAMEELAQRHQAALYVDDAHGLGVLGGCPDSAHPLGKGGGGSTRYTGLSTGNVVVVGSLSKAFGVPLAFAAGPAEFIEFLRPRASSLVHNSPPALPVLAAARHNLLLHQRQGESRRRRLLANIRCFQRSLQSAGLHPGSPALLPVQSLHYATPAAARQAARGLRAAGYWAILQLESGDNPAGGTLRFVLSALHTSPQIQALAGVLGDVDRALPRRNFPVYARGKTVRRRRVEA